ncbi:MAG: PIG-L family deacetylase [Clostridiales bacterium]|jgi:LmbE family N-acetylglucosaminyl deacetylase|nr:PIG-L family deacetylase [Clostridiales bacterium]
MRILAVGCHPDDLEINCYGTLAKYRKLGHDVAVCNIANGNLGHVVIKPDELREIRLKEAQEAAKVIGATHYTIDIGDLYVTAENDDLIRKLAAVIREVQPEVVITHYESDYMNDHIQTFYATFRATFAASCPHYEMGAEPASAPITPIYHMDTLTGVGFLPTEYVDITDVIDLKLEALACHKSQVEWMKEHDGIDFLDMVRTCSKVRGYQCGVEYAEGFRLCRHYLRMVPKRLLP